MKRILIAVGCDRYDRLAQLYGAENDAAAIYDQLAEPKGDYAAASSKLLLSPSVDDIVESLSALPFGTGDIESLTFFFAGHGGEKSGTYYLCARDTDVGRLSTTGLAANRLLSVITELKPRQANVVIDACQSGGAMLDTAALLRADALGLGTPGSMSIAFLAACGPHEYAAETASGGELTRCVLSYLNGSATLQTTRSSIDLIDLGRRVSADLGRRSADQLPITWGINLTGEGHFAQNPQFAPSTEELAKAAAVLSSAPMSIQARNTLEAHAFELWALHRELQDEVDVALLRRTLRSVVADLADDSVAITTTLRGLATSLRASAVTSSDVFAESIVLFACAELLIKNLKDSAAAEVAQQLLDEAVAAQVQSREWLVNALADDRYCLLSDGNGIADLYFLPMRLSRILGWLAVGLELGRLSGRSDPQSERTTRDIAALLLESYAPSLVPRSDAQAPYVLAFIEAARRRGWTDLAEQIIGCYFAGFIEAKGVVAIPDLPDDDAFTFSLTLGAGAEHVEQHFQANPTQFLWVLLTCGASLELDECWDVELNKLDYCGGYAFVPVTYADFAANVIEEGNNFSFQIGRDVFTLADFRVLMSRASTAVESARRDLPPLARGLALVAACLQPDRLPLHAVHLDVVDPAVHTASTTA